jgi:hypothetical protein
MIEASQRGQLEFRETTLECLKIDPQQLAPWQERCPDLARSNPELGDSSGRIIDVLDDSYFNPIGSS